VANFGWSYDPDKIAAAEDRVAKAGFQISFASDRPSLKGWWKSQQSRGVNVIAAQQDELQLYGEWRDPNGQVRGTCVGQGSSRAVEDVHISRVADGALVDPLRRVLIAFEPMYGYERKLHWGATHQWGCRCGNCPDGLAGADAAAFYSTVGVLQRTAYGDVDLSNPQEHLAIDWNNSGVPQLLLEAAKFHKINCHSSASWSEYCDPIAAKCWGHICLPKVFGMTQVITEKNGTVLPDSSGGHDTECCGIVTLPTHETAFLIQQSWGKGIKYPPTIQTVDGPLNMRPGSYAVRQSVLEDMGNQVERLSCDIPSSVSFR